MSYPMNTTRSNRFILSASAAALMTAAMAINSPLANAHEAGTQSKPSTQPVNHSKMAGMKDMSGMKHPEGMKHMDGMSMTGDVDYDFAFNMRMHHQMAVDMALLQLKNGKSPKLRTLATSIIAAQKKEIAVLDQWLKTAKKPMPKMK